MANNSAVSASFGLEKTTKYDLNLGTYVSPSTCRASVWMFALISIVNTSSTGDMKASCGFSRAVVTNQVLQFNLRDAL